MSAALTIAGRVRVCHVQVLPLLTGVQRAMLAIFDGLDPRRYELHVACQGPGPMSEELARRGIACHFVPTLDRPLHPRRDLAAYRQLRRLFRQHEFDLIHTHSSKAGFLGRLAARHAGVPHAVHHVHGFAFHEGTPPLKRRFYEALERFAAGYCDRVIFVNHEERQQAVADGIVSPGQALTIYNGVRLEDFLPSVQAPSRQAFRQRLSLAADETAILVAGRLDQQKQPLIVPEIASLLETTAGSLPWRILVAGAGPLEGELRREISVRGMERRVQLLGWLDRPAQAFHAADALLHPTLWEGLPLALIEAQAAGLPAVASRIAGNREVVHESCGFLCEPRDPAGYAWALTRLLHDAALRRTLGRAARERAEQLFDARQNYRQVVDLYERLLHLSRTEPLPRRQAA